MNNGGMYALIFVTQVDLMIPVHCCPDERQTLSEQHPYENRMQTVCEAASLVIAPLRYTMTAFSCALSRPKPAMLRPNKTQTPALHVRITLMLKYIYSALSLPAW